MSEYYLTIKDINDCLIYNSQTMSYSFGSYSDGDINWIKNSWTEEEMVNLPQWVKYLIRQKYLIKELNDEEYLVFGWNKKGKMILTKTGEKYNFINYKKYIEEDISKEVQYVFTKKEIAVFPYWLEKLHDMQMIEYKKMEEV